MIAYNEAESATTAASSHTDSHIVLFLNNQLIQIILPFASNRELRTFYHVCLRFKRRRLPLKRANLNLPIKQFLLRDKHVCKPRLQCFKNVMQCLVSVCRCSARRIIMNVNAKGRSYTQGKSLDGDLRRLIIDHCLSSGGNPVNGYLPVTYKSIADTYRVNLNTVAKIWNKFCDTAQVQGIVVVSFQKEIWSSSKY